MPLFLFVTEENEITFALSAFPLGCLSYCRALSVQQLKKTEIFLHLFDPAHNTNNKLILGQNCPQFVIVFTSQKIFDVLTLFIFKRSIQTMHKCFPFSLNMTISILEVSLRALNTYNPTIYLEIFIYTVIAARYKQSLYLFS